MPQADRFPDTLWVFAHAREADLWQEHCDKLPDDRFPFLRSGEHFFVAVCGEGEISGLRTSAILGAFPGIRNVINAGVAAGLNNQPVGSLFQADLIYRWPDDRGGFHPGTFRTHLLPGVQATQIICSGRRICETETRDFLKAMATVCDRESWYIAAACADYGVRLSVLKVISDHADGRSTAEVIAATGGLMLPIHNLTTAIYKSGNPRPNEADFRNLFHNTPKDFHYSRAMSSRITDLLVRLDPDSTGQQRLLDQTQAEVLEFSPAGMSRKDRGRQVVQNLEMKVYPLRARIAKQISRFTSVLEAAGFRVQTREGLESASLDLQLHISGPEDLHRASAALSEFDWRDWQNFCDGGGDFEENP